MRPKSAVQESLRAGGPCQEGGSGRFRAGFAARESTIARTRAAVVAPRESSGAATATTIVPVRVSTSRTCSHVRAGGSTSRDRKSTRLNSSHSQISYAVFCLKKKKKKKKEHYCHITINKNKYHEHAIRWRR